MQPLVSVVIRLTRQDILTEALVANLYAQDVKGIELLLLPTFPSGGFPEIAENFPIKVIDVPGAKPGAVLNAGFAAAQGRYVVVLSPAAMPRDYKWLGTILRHFTDPRVAAVTGHNVDQNRVAPKEGSYRQDLVDFLADPRTGFSFVAAAFLREVWERLPFDEQLDVCEDKEWGYRALKAGHELVFDHEARVHHTIRENDEEAFKRYWRENRAIGRFLGSTDEVCKEVWQHALKRAIAQKDLGILLRARQVQRQVGEMTYWASGANHALLVRKEFDSLRPRYSGA